jgi:1-deoxy-D-xylulose-5-phosphate reductoisomerase
LEFAAPDLKRFPALSIARQAGVSGGTYPAVLSAADEVAVSAFMAGEISFLRIVEIVDAVLNQHQPTYHNLTLELIAEADGWARQYARQLIELAHNRS